MESALELGSGRTQPSPADPQFIRYTSIDFPAYRFVPGRLPHPRRDPRGHSYGRPEPEVVGFSVDRWIESETYLHGVDLYNFAYWWECHEQWEAIWKSVCPESEPARFLQGLVQVAAANLRRFMGSHDSGLALAQKGIEKLAIEEDYYLGIDVSAFRAAVAEHFMNKKSVYPAITLRFPQCEIG